MENDSAPARILVGIDGSDSSIEALRGAVRIAAAMNAHIRAIIAWESPALYYKFPQSSLTPDDDAKTTLSNALMQAFGNELPANLDSAVLRGRTAQLLIEQSENADMLVLGSRGHGGFAGLLLGSVSAACAQHARCPVLIMHRAEHSKITGSPHLPPGAAANT